MTSLVKPLRNLLIGVVCLPFEAAAVVLFVGNIAAQQSITLVRKSRELVDEKEGDCFYVYYPLGNMGGAAADYILPEIVGVDVIAGALNLKTQHCKAWFTRSSGSYTTIEITAGKTEGVLARKYCSSVENDELQLVVLEKEGRLAND